MNPEQTSFRLLWIACGTDDNLFAANQKLVSVLKDKGFSVAAVQPPGGHTWMVWHNNLIHFVPLLFQGK